MSAHANNSTHSGKDWSSAEWVTAGIDVGSVSTNAVIMGDDELLSYSNIVSGGNSVESSWKAIHVAMDEIGMSLEDLRYVVSTGYGRVIVPFTDRNMSEVSCHALGAHWFFPDGGVIIDIGGQDTKIIRYDEKGRLLNFVFSDKCAAGCGRYLEVIADLLGICLEDLGDLTDELEKKLPAISSSCVLFAKSEALGLIREGVPSSTIMAAYCHSLARIIATQAERLGVAGDLILTGGGAKNRLVVRSLEKWFGVQAKISFEPQIVGALGAARYAEKHAKKISREQLKTHG